MIKDGNFAIKFHILTGTTQRVASAYHPQVNGLVQHQNRTIQGSMLKVLEDALQGALFVFIYHDTNPLVRHHLKCYVVARPSFPLKMKLSHRVIEMLR